MANSKEHILSTALSLFSEKGYHSVGISEICESSGVTKPTLYYFFESKEGLLRAILDKCYKPLNSLIAEKSLYKFSEDYQSDVYPVLYRVAEAYFSYAESNREFYRMYLAIIFSASTDSVRHAADGYIEHENELLSRMFSSILSYHTNLKGKEETLAVSFKSIINGYSLLMLDGRLSIDSSLIHSIVHQFMHGIF